VLLEVDPNSRLARQFAMGMYGVDIPKGSTPEDAIKLVEEKDTGSTPPVVRLARPTVIQPLEQPPGDTVEITFECRLTKSYWERRVGYCWHEDTISVPYDVVLEGNNATRRYIERQTMDIFGDIYEEGDSEYGDDTDNENSEEDMDNTSFNYEMAVAIAERIDNE
tara:strand:+ start:150 stop:644 length:495 start_codon:yes stop_codon:yes gene_type:complete